MIVGNGVIVQAIVHGFLGFALLLRRNRYFRVIVELLVRLLYKLLLILNAMLDVLLEAVILPSPFVVGVLRP